MTKIKPPCWASSCTQPLAWMRMRIRMQWAKCRPACAGASCAPLWGGACWPVLRPKRFEAQGMLAYRHSGFSVDTNVCISANDRAVLVPPPRAHRHRYFGVLAQNSPHRAAVVATCGRC